MSNSFMHAVEYVGFGQVTNERCWYAAYRMIYEYLNKNQYEIEDKLKKKLDFDDAYENGLLVSDYRIANDALGLEILDAGEFRKDLGFFELGLSTGAKNFLKELEKKPLWVSRYVKSGVYHITVAVGYDEKNSDIIFHNPFSGSGSALGNQRIKANAYVRHITRQIGSVQMP